MMLEQAASRWTVLARWSQAPFAAAGFACVWIDIEAGKLLHRDVETVRCPLKNTLLIAWGSIRTSTISPGRSQVS